jgi:hypothetical protein
MATIVRFVLVLFLSDTVLTLFFRTTPSNQALPLLCSHFGYFYHIIVSRPGTLLDAYPSYFYPAPQYAAYDQSDGADQLGYVLEPVLTTSSLERLSQ